MSDISGTGPRETGAMDHFDRLLARHTPAASRRTGVVQVRPRLAGPFERVEAVPARREQDEEPVWPTTPRAEAPERDRSGEPGRREIHARTETERTLVRTEHTREAAAQAALPLPHEEPAAALLRPSATVTPEWRPAPEAAATPRETQDAATPSRPAAPPGSPFTAATAAVSARPGPAETAAAREAVRQIADRRSGRTAESVVQVQIGRVEVTAAPAGGSGRGQSPAPRRPGATVSLADYLARGRE